MNSPFFLRFATNWLAVKLIFEPVLPVKVGPFTIQGIFLQRQQEVSAAFAEFYVSSREHL